MHRIFLPNVGQDYYVTQGNVIPYAVTAAGGLLLVALRNREGTAGVVWALDQSLRRVEVCLPHPLPRALMILTFSSKNSTPRDPRKCFQGFEFGAGDLKSPHAITSDGAGGFTSRRDSTAPPLAA